MGEGIRVDGAFYNEDDSELTWDGFIDKIESVGLSYGGLSLPIDDEGNVLNCNERVKPKITNTFLAKVSYGGKLPVGIERDY